MAHDTTPAYAIIGEYADQSGPAVVITVFTDKDMAVNEMQRLYQVQPNLELRLVNTELWK
jgi:hypothetical protein